MIDLIQAQTARDFEGYKGELQRALPAFKSQLETFVAEHKDAIRSDANFRQKFIEMCASLGVDPMSSNKTFSAKLGFGSFYTELGVQVLDVCMRTRSSNGGLIGLQDLTRRVISLRGSNSGGIESGDILRAVRSLQLLDPGFSLVSVSGSCMISSVPRELVKDHQEVLGLQLVRVQGCFSVSQLKQALGWLEHRCYDTVNFFLKEGILWHDNKSTSPLEQLYWFPSIFFSYAPGGATLGC